MMTKLGSVVRGSMMACLLAAGIGVAGTAEARDEAFPSTCVPEPGGGMSAIICTIGSGSGTSTFLGAFASDNNGKGGWVEFYSDSDGEWWVEHHADGGTAVGWDVGSYGQNVMGPKLSFGTPEGSYDKKPRPAMSGKTYKIGKRSYAAAKAAASKTTGTPTAVLVSTPKILSSATTNPVEVSFTGSGQCKAAIVVRKDGKLLSSTGIVPVTFPSKRTLQLTSGAGEYVVELRGKDGCLNQFKSTKVLVEAPMRIVFPKAIKVSGL